MPPKGLKAKKRAADGGAAASASSSKKKKKAASKPSSPLSADLFSAERVAGLKERYDGSSPFPHVELPDLCEEDRARAILQEAQTGLRADYKETDLFKVYQTGDLATVEDTCPQLCALRDAIYSQEFRDMVSEAAGCGPLVDRTDCSCNVYMQGGHLLCHDDVIGTRRVSYIIYLTDPDEPWTAEDGGALELYPLASEGSLGVPSTVPSKSIFPRFNQMVMFTVTPGEWLGEWTAAATSYYFLVAPGASCSCVDAPNTPCDTNFHRLLLLSPAFHNPSQFAPQPPSPGASFHAVQEVLTEGRPRLSISGWFHGETPPPGMELATLMQLKPSQEGGAADDAGSWASELKWEGYTPVPEVDDAGDSTDDDAPVELAPADKEYLAQWLNPVYLESDALTKVSV